MTPIEITEYADSVRNCLEVLDKARPSDGIRDCSGDCRVAAEQIKAYSTTGQKNEPG